MSCQPTGRRRYSSAYMVAALTPLERQYVDTVGRLLFFTEFLLLLNYVEVIIPAIYCECSLVLVEPLTVPRLTNAVLSSML